MTLDKSFHPASNFEMNTVDVTEKSQAERTCNLKYGAGLTKSGSLKLTTDQPKPTELTLSAEAKMDEFAIDHKVS